MSFTANLCVSASVKNMFLNKLKRHVHFFSIFLHHYVNFQKRGACDISERIMVENVDVIYVTQHKNWYSSAGGTFFTCLLCRFIAARNAALTLYACASKMRAYNSCKS